MNTSSTREFPMALVIGVYHRCGVVCATMQNRNEVLTDFVSFLTGDTLDFNVQDVSWNYAIGAAADRCRDAIYLQFRAITELEPTDVLRLVQTGQGMGLTQESIQQIINVWIDAKVVMYGSNAVTLSPIAIAA